MSFRDTWDRLLDRFIDLVTVPFDFLQQRLGRDQDDDNPHDPTLWL
ncbi:hypothetical protein DSM104443_02712 [Usitatibacter rugosus]|uniref:Uncharacterized protein n=1 Tax=Usitatibacter rugosus TaxID=2732067 RepID=A0A6M4GYZ4_9PROT|nr:hypothetical protein [Usitatibacter rugosus]QJR11633.1 hypothetical protein DSM104443_02712 [Usitatibacter rugosus]